MLDLILYFLLKYTYLLAAALFAVKIILFLKHKNKNWTLLQFIYFNQINIRLTSNSDRARLKKLQNSLSIAIVILLAIQILSVLFF